MLGKSLACLAVCAIAFLHGEIAPAQNVIQVRRVDMQGTVLNVTPQGVAMRTATGDYLADMVHQGINIGPAQVEIHGNESPKFLQPGMFVRLEAELEFMRNIKGKVSGVKLIALNNQPARPVPPEIGGRPRQPGFPGAQPLGGAANPLLQPGFIRLDAPPEGEEKGPRGKPVIPKLAKFAIVGQVATPVRRNVFSIAVPDGRSVKKLKVPLDDDAQVELFLTDIRFARPGDKISAKGSMQVGANQRQFWATQIRITRGDPADNVAAAQPLKPGERRKFGDVGKGEDPKGEAGVEFEGIILKIN